MPEETWDIGGGGNSFPFDTIGDFVKGYVVGYEPNLKQTDPKTGEVKTFNSGDPMLMHRVELEVIESNLPDVGAGDNRSIYLKGAKKLVDAAQGIGSTQAAVAAALKATTNGTALQYRGVLTLQYVAEQPDAPRGQSPAKYYRAWYEAPTFQVGTPDPTPAPVVPAVPSPGPAPSASIPAAAAPATPAAVAPAMPAAPATAAASPGLTPEQEAAIAAALGQTATPAWDADPRVAPLRARGVPDDTIRTVLGL